MYRCGKFCCCATNYEFHADARRPFGRGMLVSSLGTGNCLKCDEDRGDLAPAQFGVGIVLEQADRNTENGTSAPDAQFVDGVECQFSVHV